MADAANLPTQADLNSLYGAWNPASYIQGFRNQDLADQFRQQAYQQQVNATKEGQLKNSQSEVMNPLLVDQQTLTNKGKSIANDSSELDLSSKKDMYSDNQKLLHSKVATALSDEELSQASNHFLKLYQTATLNNDTEGMNKYGSILDTLTGAVASKAADRVQNRNLKEGDWVSAGNIARGHDQATLDAAQIRASKPQTGKDPQVVFQSLSPERRLGISQMALETGINPFTQEPLSEQQRAQFQAIHDQDERTVNATLASKQQQGITLSVPNTGGSPAIVNKAPPVVNKPSTTGTTKSGTKYQVVPE